MKKIWALVILIATAILSGAMLSRFLNWAGRSICFAVSVIIALLIFTL